MSRALLDILVSGHGNRLNAAIVAITMVWIIYLDEGEVVSGEIPLWFGLRRESPGHRYHPGTGRPGVEQYGAARCVLFYNSAPTL